MRGFPIFLFMFLGLSFFCGSVAEAQFNQDPDDLGEADTLDLVVTVAPDFTTNQLQVQLDLYVFNDTNTFSSVSAGFQWDNPNLQMDSAVASQVSIDALDIGPFFYEDNDINITNANQRFLFGGARIFKPGFTPNPTRQLWGSYYFTLSDWQVCDSIPIDTLTFNAGSVLLFVSTNGNYSPYWTGRFVIRDTACTQANLIVDPDSLGFEGVQGGSSPAPQLFTVLSDGLPLNFDLVENIPWIVVSPVTGITTQQITVLPNIVGLSAGTYVDSIRVQSGQATNSPLYVKVTFVVEEPPPVINVMPSQFFFNAIAGGSNPADKILTIKNTGGQTLNWTVSNSETWLSLSPGAGVDSGDVTVSVDITGLAFGDYHDTIVVSDPNATNDPVKVPVMLTVASDLPVIAVDSTFNYVVVPTGVSSIPPETLLVKNDGAGTMNFTLQESSSRILTLTPSSGTAPQEVEVEFKVTSGSAGDVFSDTVWVFSNEAINSPYPVVFEFHFVENPAYIQLSTDTVRLNLYECEMGTTGSLPIGLFTVSNVGGDNPMNLTFVWESDLFEVTNFSSVAPALVQVRSKFLDLPLGVYLDTITIVAQNAINNPRRLIVKYNVIPATQVPEIVVSLPLVTIPAQENSGPVPPNSFAINNKYGGCMDWYIEEDVPWLTPSDSFGTNPGDINLNADASGYLFGEYPDSFFVFSDTASNSPVKVDLLFRVWRFHGDLNYDAFINVLDVTYFVAYLFQMGPGPQPTFFVGDLNCNHKVNVEDLTYLIDYLFRHGPIPCGNPYK